MQHPAGHQRETGLPEEPLERFEDRKPKHRSLCVRPKLNRAWLELMMDGANSPAGLHPIPEAAVGVAQ